MPYRGKRFKENTLAHSITATEKTVRSVLIDSPGLKKQPLQRTYILKPMEWQLFGCGMQTIREHTKV